MSMYMGLYFRHQWIECEHMAHARQGLWHPTPVLLPGKSHGRRNLVGCSPQGRKELDATERLPFHFSLSCIGEGNGNPLQCCCLENPRDRGAWWAAVYGVAQSRTWLKRLSSSRQGLRTSSVPLTKAEWYHQSPYVFKERRVVQFVVLATQMEDEDE